MSAPLLAEFDGPEPLLAAIAEVRRAGHRVHDAFTPFPVDGVAEAIERPRSRIRLAMLATGLAVAALAYFVQWYSAVVDYPLNVGGRPLHSWPVFLLVPFEVGVFAAALAGFAAFLWSCGLPRLHAPVFAVPGFERATQDRFFLLAETNEESSLQLRHLLEKTGAGVVSEVRGA